MKKILIFSGYFPGKTAKTAGNGSCFAVLCATDAAFFLYKSHKSYKSYKAYKPYKSY